jgi:uncharacterized protein YecA (UPF0149 family)
MLRAAYKIVQLTLAGWLSDQPRRFEDDFPEEAATLAALCAKSKGVGRNDPCPCGATVRGRRKKFKQCCGGG